MTKTAEAAAQFAREDDGLPAIPYVDVREKGPLGLLEDHKDKAADLIEASRGVFGWISRALAAIALPIGDFLGKRWLKKTGNPYREEILAAAKLVGSKGFVALNMSYEWGCTTGAFQTDPAGAPLLSRILDWPFPRLGHNLVIAHQKGPAGEFHNVTWPGVSGVFQAAAEGRFAAAINQAPMRRHWTGLILDWARNRHIFNNQTGLPPAHLLRKAFETAADYAAAKEMLATERISIPVIYTLSGTKPGEGCVIERTETKAVIREMKNGRVAAANHFESALNGEGRGWMPRATNSHDRICFANEMPVRDVADDFAWFVEPIANPLSRLAMTADAGAGMLKVMGTAGAAPVTKVFRLG